MGQFVSQFFNAMANPGTVKTLMVDVAVTATIINYMFLIPVPLTVNTGVMRFDVLNMNDATTQFILKHLTPIQVNVSLSAIGGIVDANLNVLGTATFQVTDKVPLVNLVLPTINIDVLDPNTGIQLGTAAMVGTTVNTNNKQVTGTFMLPQNFFTPAQLAALTAGAVAGGFNTPLKITVRGSAVQPAGTQTAMANVMTGFSPVTLTMMI
eukprot:TRINITY_DN3026_c0_g2_i1.p1 TRINITY_DN3026_c0_g2~~TRINITY_DN3026_c0_g2_i1.p1  ORF type:complete len:209 (-),score=67.68 TRINITY_DN3026_c0_g2_i1:34-660(-)